MGLFMVLNPISYKKQTIFCKSSENMKELHNDSVDVIVTSPPYNIGKIYSEEEPFSDLKEEDVYLEFLGRVFSECFRVLKPSGVFYLNIGDSAKDQGKSEKVVQKAVDNHDGVSTNALRAILKQGIDRVRPEGDRRFTGEWILYNILEMKFMEGRKVRDIAMRLAMSEADLYRKQRVAIEAVANAIIEMETHAREEEINNKS